MPDQIIVEQCSPTLAGIKTANMFPYHYNNKREMWEDIRCFNRFFSERGIRMIPIRVQSEVALIYLYRPARLKKDLNNTIAAALLRKFGYIEADCGRCIRHLVERFQESREFPHEIGLFLGYPPEDVKGFMEHRDEAVKCVGCWKVYGDKASAEECFASYKRCTRIYKEQYDRGVSIERLAVSI